MGIDSETVITRVVDVTTTADPDAAVDGRRLRSERSRNAVTDALLGLYESGVIRPSAAQIAEVSGVSERSLFRHFTDLEDLASTAIARQFAIVAPFFEAPSREGDLAHRVDSIVDQRVALAARMHHLARAAAYHAVSSPTIAATVGDRRRLLRLLDERRDAAVVVDMAGHHVVDVDQQRGHGTAGRSLGCLRDGGGGDVARVLLSREGRHGFDGESVVAMLLQQLQRDRQQLGLPLTPRAYRVVGAVSENRRPLTQRTAVVPREQSFAQMSS